MNTSLLSRRLLKPVRWSCRHPYSTAAHLPPLPPIGDWREAFAHYTKDRVSLYNPRTTASVAHSLFSPQSPVAGENKVIIEAFPGPGALSRALLELPKSTIRKLIILEDNTSYLPYLRALEEADSRVKVVPLSGFDWDAYSTMEESGLLDDIESVPWEGGLHPQLHFISHLPVNIKGEQLIAQFFRCIPDRSWLYKYGRVPLSIVLSDFIWSRMNAPIHVSRRCKLSVIAEATAQLSDAVDPKKFLPYDDNFFPQTTRMGQERLPETRRIGNPLRAVNIVPHEDQLIERGMLEKWDFCLRRLFVLKSTPFKRAIGSLAPGAQTLLKALTDPSLPPEQRLDVSKPPRDLTVADWALVLRAFDNWPFAPDDLMISDAFSRNTMQR
ncbi:S-adenosyl-L-methionine-dependent methyltransferase [Amylocystis lapponica]|nr:S-adenosyl-L-methionine-dependent methyltransferase [Amylocystis lapponica]